MSGQAMDVDGVRAELPGFQHCHTDFMVRKQKFTQQFASMYYQRLDKLKLRLEQLVKHHWPKLPVVRVLDAQEQECVLITTLYKQTKNKPNFLTEYTAVESGEVECTEPSVIPDSYCGEGDYFIAEDESGRVTLTGTRLEEAELCSGVVAALRGSLQDKGRFNVDDVLLPGLGPQAPLAPVRPGPGKAQYVAFISGPRFGCESAELKESLEGLAYGLTTTETTMLSRIGRLVVAGGLLAPSEDVILRGKIKLDNADHKSMQGAPLVGNVQRADKWLARVAQALPVDVLPGFDDPSNSLVPHQPLHPVLLPRSHGEGACFVPSPCRFMVNDSIDMVGSCGDAVTDARRYISGSSLSALRLCCEAANLAPTAPDTLPSFPFSDRDPFVLDRAPHVMFAGMQDKFATELVRGADGQRCRLVCIPDWSRGERKLVVVDFQSEDLSAFLIDVPVRGGTSASKSPKGARSPRSLVATATQAAQQP